jgi:hypothetical protein
MFVMSVEYIKLAAECSVYATTVSNLQVQHQQLTFPNRPHHTNSWRVHHNEYFEQHK